MENQMEPNSHCVEAYYEDSGALQPSSDNDTADLFRDLEHELEELVQRYHVPPNDLEKLFQVVQTMFDMLDQSREACEQLEEQRNELEELWKTEKDKWRVAQRKRLDVECRLEEERMKIDVERQTLHTDKLQLETKLRNVAEEKRTFESDLTRLREKMDRDEHTRQELIEEYRQKYEIAKIKTIRRRESLHRQHRAGTSPLDAETGPVTRVQQTPESPIFSEDSLSLVVATSVTSESSVATSAEAWSHAVTQRREKSPPAVPLEEELRSADEAVSLEQSYKDSNGMEGRLTEVDEEEDEEEEQWFKRHGALGSTLEDELLSVDPALLAPAKVEMDMLQKEKAEWEREREQLEKKTREIARARDDLVSLNTQLQLDFKHSKASQSDLENELREAKQERDDILTTYLDQNFDDYCITRKELHELLMKHHKTAIELEQEKEEKLRLQQMLDSKKSLFERLKERMKKVFSRGDHPRPFTSPRSSVDRHSSVDRRSTPSDFTTNMDSLSPPPLSPPMGVLSPLTRSLTTVLEQGPLVASTGWLTSSLGSIRPDNLPLWVGQVPLAGIEIEKIDVAAVGQVYYKDVGELPSFASPPRLRGFRRTSGPLRQSASMELQQLHVEVWVATNCSASLAYIEIVEVMCKPAKVRQRFIVKPRSKHILGMKCIPGAIDQSTDFTDSAHLSNDTSWVEASYASPNSTLQRSGLAEDHTGLGGVLSESYTGSAALTQGPTALGSWSAPTKRRSHTIDITSSESDLHFKGQLDFDRSTAVERIVCSSTPVKMSAVARDPLSGEERERDQDAAELYATESFDDLPNSASSSSLTDDGSFSALPTDRCNSVGSEAHFKDKAGALPLRGLRAGVKHVYHQSNFHDSIPENSVPIRSGGDSEVDQRSERSDDFPDLPGDSPHQRLLSSRETRRRRQSSGIDTPTVMWVITESKRLIFYPTTNPSHRPINTVYLQETALCIEYIRKKVYIGLCNSLINVYSIDEFSGSWDIDNPDKIELPNPDPSEQLDVKCLSEVGDKLWVGAGPFIFILDAESNEREGSIMMDNWRRKPERIVSLGNKVVVGTKASAFYVYDAKSVQLLRKFDITPMARNLGGETATPGFSAPLEIKSIVADDRNIYAGTTSGQIVAVPIQNLGQLSQADSLVTNASLTTPDGPLSMDFEEPDGVFVEQSAVALHMHKDDKVRSLLFVPLPLQKHACQDAQIVQQYRSLPNLSGPLYRFPFQPLYKSLVISVGKGHVEYSMELFGPHDEDTSKSRLLRDRNEAFQLLVWGHKNPLPLM